MRQRDAGGLSPKPPLLTMASPEERSAGLRCSTAEWIERCTQMPTKTVFWNWPSICQARQRRPCLSWPVGGRPQFVQPAAAGPVEFAESRKVAESTAQYGVAADPFEHPDAQRRFRLMTNVEELERALDFPWEKWAVFLHPAQREIVEKELRRPVSRGRCRRYRKDHRGNPPGRVSRTQQPGHQGPAHHVFGYLG